MLSLPTTHPFARRTSRWRPSSLGASIVLVLMVVGCAAQPGAQPPPSQPSSAPEGGAVDDASAAPADGSAGTATFTVDGRAFTVDLTLCGVYGDGPEIALAGAASEDGGDALGHFEGDLVPFGSELNGEFRIDISPDGQARSSDEFLALGYASGVPVTLSEEDDGYVIRSGAWNENGEDLGEGSVQFACS